MDHVFSNMISSFMAKDRNCWRHVTLVTGKIKDALKVTGCKQSGIHAFVEAQQQDKD
jgi:hypothetical protein